MAVADAVVARQVAARLGRGQHVVDRHRQLGVRQADLHDLRPLRRIPIPRGVDGRSHLGIQPVDRKKLAR